MQQLQLSEATAARRRIPIRMVDSSDGFTAETGLTLTVTLSKNGAAFGASGGTSTEVANGIYYYEATAAELDTVGFLCLKATSTGARDFYALVQVVSFDVYATDLGIPNAANLANLDEPSSDILGAVTTLQATVALAADLTALATDVDALQATVALAADLAALAADVATLQATVALAADLTALATDVDALQDDLTVVLGLVQCNFVLDNTVNDDDGMTSARIRLFATPAAVDSATDGGSGQGQIAEFAVTCTFEDPGKVTIYKCKRITVFT